MKSLALSLAVIALSSVAFAEEVHHYSYQGQKRPVTVRGDQAIPSPTYWVPEERKQKSYQSSLKPQRKWGGGSSSFSGVSFPSFPFSGVASFSNPAFSAPSYSAPAFSAPQFSNPAYGNPSFSAPGFGNPNFSAPTFAAPAFR